MLFRSTDAMVETTLPLAHLDDVEAASSLLRRSAMPVADVLAKYDAESSRDKP